MTARETCRTAIRRRNSGFFATEVRGSKWCRAGQEGTQFICDTTEEAVAACQADFEQRVRSALHDDVPEWAQKTVQELWRQYCFVASAAEASSQFLSTDDAETALFQAIWDIKIGNKTDDKLILENLRKAGYWLARFEPAASITKEG